MEKKKGFFSGAELRTVAVMAWPAVVESFFVALAGVIDTLMVSGIDAAAVASVGLTTQPKFCGLALFIAANVATSAIVARRKGEERREDANRTLVAVTAFTILASLLIGLLCVIFASPLMRLAGSNEQTHEGAVLYFQLIMGGMIFNTVSLVINAAQRGSGNTRISMKTNLVSSGINVVFNYLLIGGHLGFPALGIFGAAFATVLGTVAACMMSIASLMKKDGFLSIPYCLSNRLRFQMKSLTPVLKLGSSVFLEQILMRIGFTATAVMAAGLGTYAMAAHQVGMNMLSLSFSFGDGFQAAAVALIGQSLGRRDPKQASRYGTICQVMGMTIAVLFSILLLCTGRNIYGWFFREEEIIKIGLGICRILVVIVLAQIPQAIITGSLRGAGDVLYTTVSSTISVTLIRTAISYTACFILGWGINGIWMGILADQACRFVFNFIRYRSGKWMKIVI